MAKLLLNQFGQSFELPHKLLSLEPTHTSRYWILVRILTALDDPEKLRILDVGGKKGLLRSFPGFSPTIIDIEEGDEPGYIQGSALDMPFKDNEFDYAVSCDVLEHIPQKDRRTFLMEMLRVSKKGVILCAPFDNPGNSALEVKMNDYYVRLSKQQHRWLREHIDNGLPRESEVEKVLNEQSLDYSKFRHFSPAAWECIVREHLLHTTFGDNIDFGKMIKDTYKDYYDTLCSFDFSKDGYRTFFIISKNKLPLIELPSEQTIKAARQKFLASNELRLLDVLERTMGRIRKLTAKNNVTSTQLNKQQQEIDNLRAELEAIKSTKAWRVLRHSKSVARRLGLRATLERSTNV